MTKRASPEKQHTVPKFLLKGFVDSKSRQLFVFDKTSSSVFLQSPERAAKQGGFYDLLTPAGMVSLEPALASLESRAAQVLAEVRRKRSLAFVSTDDVAAVALLAAVQFLRTTNHREKLQAMSVAMAKRLEEFASARDIASVFPPMNSEQAKAMSIEMLASAHNLAPHFAAKAWVLFAAPPSSQLITSDNPVVLYNSVDHGWLGSIGLAVRGIEIYLPLDRGLILGFLCPSLIAQAAEGVDAADSLLARQPTLASEIRAKSLAARQLMAAVQTGEAFPCSADTVTFFNSQQVHFSERFLFSPTRDFSLVEEMLSKNPSLRTGPRMSIG